MLFTEQKGTGGTWWLCLQPRAGPALSPSHATSICSRSPSCPGRHGAHCGLSRVGSGEAAVRREQVPALSSPDRPCFGVGAGEGREDLERGVCTWPVGAGTVVPSPPTGHRHSHHGHSPLLPPPPKLQTRGGSLPCSRLCTGQGHIAPRTGRVRPTKGASALPNGHTSEMEGRQREARASMGKSDPATSTDNGCNRRQGRVKWCWTQGLHRNLGSRQCIVGESSPYRDSSHTQGPTLHSLQPLPIPHNAPGPGASTAGRWHPPRDQVRGGARVL